PPAGGDRVGHLDRRQRPGVLVRTDHHAHSDILASRGHSGVSRLTSRPREGARVKRCVDGEKTMRGRRKNAWKDRLVSWVEPPSTATALLLLGRGADPDTEKGVECPGDLPAPSDPDLVERAARAKAALGDRVFVLGHHYQRDEVIQFADVTGDSFKLA